MNYGYNNFYGQQPYNPYGMNNGGMYQQPQMQYQQPINNNMYSQQQVQQPTQQQSYLPLTFVSGVEGAKAFIVSPNQVVYLKDSDSDILFEKKADSQGKYTLSAYRLTQVDLNNMNKQAVVEQPKINTGEFLTKKDIKDFITNSELENFKKVIEGNIGQLSSRIEKLLRSNSNAQKQKESE